jgi:hypothetical protein
MGITMACITSLALTSLYESIQVMEDPFTAYVTLDGVNCLEELFLQAEQLLIIRDEIFPNAIIFEPPKPGALTAPASATDTIEQMEEQASKEFGLQKRASTRYVARGRVAGRRRLARQIETRDLMIGGDASNRRGTMFYTHG